jgi:hypothetical protein
MTPAEHWHSLLRPDVELAEPYWTDLSGRLRKARLTFGDRPLCPFLRPFFLDASDQARVRRVAEVIALLGERVVEAAMASPAIRRQVRLTDEEERLVRIDPRYGRASTASRLDAFILPDSLEFAEYNAESPAGLAYSENLAEVFDRLEVADRFRAQYRTRFYRPTDAMLFHPRQADGEH